MKLFKFNHKSFDFKETFYKFSKFILSTTKVGTIWNIPLYIDPTFKFMFSVVCSLSISLLDITPIILTICMYAMILGHELSHIYAAQKFGHKAESIYLYLFGGMAFLDPKVFLNPIKIGVVAMAGPVFNIVLVPIFWFLSDYGVFFSILHYINLLMIWFNILPLPVLDGSKILFSAIWLITKKPIQALNLSYNIFGITAGFCSITFMYYGRINLLVYTIIVTVLGFFVERKQLLNMYENHL